MIDAINEKSVLQNIVFVVVVVVRNDPFNCISGKPPLLFPQTTTESESIFPVTKLNKIAIHLYYIVLTQTTYM